MSLYASVSETWRAQRLHVHTFEVRRDQVQFVGASIDTAFYIDFSNN